MSWLKEFVEINISVNELADRLTFSGIEVSNIESIGIYNPNVICGKIISKRLLKNRNDVFHLKLEVSEGKVIETVSTANELFEVQEGQHIAIALPTAILFESGDDDYSTKSIEENIMYNQLCACTICSVKELGIGMDAFKLFLLPAAINPGSVIRSYFEPHEEWFADEVLTLEILANISRCQSMTGVAKEISAITRKYINLNRTSKEISSIIEPAGLGILNRIPTLVKYFSLTSIKNVTVQKSPDFIRRRLSLSGIKPISNLIDIGNYVMLETGQPVHVYSANRLASKDIEVKLSEGGEQFTPLTSHEIKTSIILPRDVITINSGNDIISIGGIIGSDDTAVTNETTDIVLEVGNFDFISIRKSQNKLKLYTEASARFSKE